MIPKVKWMLEFSALGLTYFFCFLSAITLETMGGIDAFFKAYTC